MLSARDSQGQEERGLNLSPQEIQEIGEKIFANECGSKEENLTLWNKGEDFLSVGIGHFIWHPAQGKDIVFEEGFKKFLEYAKNSGEILPDYLDKTPFPACPWNSREHFLSSQGDTRLIELKDFLMRTKNAQAAFIVKQLEGALTLMLDAIPEDSREKIISRFERVASTSSGIYVLADYLNFKGLGIAPAEKYQGQGWGLLQVLEGMKDEKEAPDAVKEFSRSAILTLQERVKNAPPERNEQKWLPGWHNRINSYLIDIPE